MLATPKEFSKQHDPLDYFENHLPEFTFMSVNSSSSSGTFNTTKRLTYFNPTAPKISDFIVEYQEFVRSELMKLDVQLLSCSFKLKNGASTSTIGFGDKGLTPNCYRDRILGFTIAYRNDDLQGTIDVRLVDFELPNTPETKIINVSMVEIKNPI